MHHILLDEVQKLGSFESVLNGFLRKTNIDIFATGSNSKLLSKDITIEFEGKGGEIHILFISFSEHFAFKQGNKTDAYDEYSAYGG